VAPASPLQTFRDAALRSGLISRERWAAAVSTVGNEPARLAEHLVAEGVFTRYQVQQLQAGRGKLTLGPYQITDWIGQGGMGQVFKAVHSVMGRQCAVKVLPMEKSTIESRESFLREIRLQAGLDCPYLVRAYDAGHDGNVHYLVTEYVPGTDLRRLVRQGGPLTMSSAANVIRQAALGLHYAHGLGLIHRDVKPGNILVTPDGHAKVSDVGLAAWMGMADDPRAGKIVGTADYLSPEQIRTPREIGPTSDIYSLGCTLYYAVTGKVPFPGGDAREKCRRHLEETPWHPRRFAPDLSEDLVELIAEMMEKDPLRRIGSAWLVAERLHPWCDGQPERFPATSVPSPWMPAPPPAEVAGDQPTEREPASQSSMEYPRGEPTAIGSPPKGSSLPESKTLPPPLPGWTGAENAGLRQERLGVALVLAIVIPISLFVGAVIGFLVRGQM
jgi:serine/threonine protein kinase